MRAFDLLLVLIDFTLYYSLTPSVLLKNNKTTYIGYRYTTTVACGVGSHDPILASLPIKKAEEGGVVNRIYVST